MKSRAILLLPILASTIYGCAQRDTVIFVTGTNFGINAETKPPTANIGYDRVEGYFGPRAANGGMPPVVASLQSDGNVFNPKIRQVYATGAAATLVVGPAGTVSGPVDLVGSDRKMAFFGTATTIGLKAGFDESGAPDSLNFGFKRKELSVIPLGIDNGKSIYPSVLASVDTTVATTTLRDTGLTISQYFATGKAAEILASTNDTVRNSFTTITNNAVMATLTPAQQAVAQDDANKALGAQKVAVEKVMNAAAPDGILDKAKLATLISKANSSRPGSVNTDLGNVANAANLRTSIKDDLHTTSSLALAVDGQ